EGAGQGRRNNAEMLEELPARRGELWGRHVSGEPSKKASFALQGGGAHGAFVWGMMDRVLEDGRLDIEAISATSAGAMHAVAMASGMASGGVDGARQSLPDFWYEVSRMDLVYDFFSPL